MLNNLIALALIALSFLPSFDIKNRIVDTLQGEMVKEPTIAIQENGSSQVPEEAPNFSGLSSTSKAALFIDYESGRILFEKNKDLRLPMASTTKLFTALIALEHAEPTDIVTVPAHTILPLDTTMGLTAGDKVSVSDLLHGLLIQSGADASYALSNYVAGTEDNFVALMNERAAKLGLKDTQFTNSIGYDDTGHYSTASDLAKISGIALTNPLIAEIVSKKSYTAASQEGKKYYLSNTNLLLGAPNYKGIKTGTTFMAGQCLASLYDDGRSKIIGVLLGSGSRFAETEHIIEWTKSSFTW
jgi:D-alanyl-D-alanine carboxypeptidase (penicillin-binding protein 5/6)